jgi:antitoxin ParD1/3/4
MTITLPPELQTFVEAEIASGKYTSADDVLGKALQLLRDHQRREELLQAIDQGIADSESGRITVFDDAAVERFKAKGRAALRE